MLDRQGFTLIELIITIAMIAILATALALTVYRAPSEHARDSKRIQDMLAFQKALEQCYSLLGNQYPTAIPTGGGSLVCGTETVLNPVPRDPRHPLATPYLVPTLTSSDYCICAYLERKSANSADSNCSFSGFSPTPGSYGGFYCVKNSQ